MKRNDKKSRLAANRNRGNTLESAIREGPESGRSRRKAPEVMKAAKARRKALREAAQAGVSDIEAGRFRDFEGPKALRGHLGAIAGDVVTGRAARPKPKR